MGAGKSSVGLLLAQQLGWVFADLDREIETRSGRCIADIFREAGESAFRRAEQAALREVLARAHPQPLVLALGGGAFVEAENAHAVHEAGLTSVFLDASAAELRRRCAPDGSQRPLFKDEDRFNELYERRHPDYLKADVRIETTGLTVEEVAAVVAKSLGLPLAVSGSCN